MIVIKIKKAATCITGVAHSFKYSPIISLKVQETEFSFKHLKKDQLGLRHAISQAVALNAPGGTIVLYITSTASLIGFTFTQYPSGALAIPLILILSLVIYGLMSFSMYEFSKKLSSSGGYYTFVSRGLGNSAGFLTAISYVSYQ